MGTCLMRTAKERYMVYKRLLVVEAICLVLIAVIFIKKLKTMLKSLRKNLRMKKKRFVNWKMMLLSWIKRKHNWNLTGKMPSSNCMIRRRNLIWKCNLFCLSKKFFLQKRQMMNLPNIFMVKWMLSVILLKEIYMIP